MSCFLATSDADIGRCFAVMVQLRPHLPDAAAFVARARRQMERDGWRLAFVRDETGRVAAFCGFRVKECLATGRTFM